MGSWLWVRGLSASGYPNYGLWLLGCLMSVCVGRVFVAECLCFKGCVGGWLWLSGLMSAYGT